MIKLVLSIFHNVSEQEENVAPLRDLDLINVSCGNINIIDKVDIELVRILLILNPCQTIKS